MNSSNNKTFKRLIDLIQVDDGTPGIPRVIIEVSALLIISLVGTTGNILLIIIIMGYKKLRTVANGFILNLSICNLVISMFIIPDMIPARIYGRWLFGEDWCSLHGYLQYVNEYCSCYTLAVISINRYILLAYPLKYIGIFSLKRGIIINIIIWIISFLNGLPPLIGWGRYYYDPKRDNCIFKRDKKAGYSIFLGLFGIFIPLFITGLCYVRILLLVRRSRRKVLSLRNNHLVKSQCFTREEMRVTKNLFIIYIVFFLCSFPINIVLFADPKGLVAGEVYSVTFTLLLGNSAINPIVYGAMNQTFRDGFRNFFSGFYYHCGGSEDLQTPVIKFERAEMTERGSKQ